MTTLQNEVEIDSSVNQRESIVSCVRRFGSSASAAILDPNCSYFILPDIDGLIGYKVESSCVVVYGDPICSEAKRSELVRAFHDFCKEKNWNIIYITASEGFAKWSVDNHLCEAMIEFGEELVIDPHDDPKARKGVNGSLVRRKVRHALKEGATVAEYHPSDTALENAIEQVGALWLEGREGLQIHTSNIHIFNDRNGKRWFYASKEGKVVGVVVLNQLERFKGYLLNYLMHTKEAPNGTPELLLTFALDTVAKEHCNYVTFGSVPAATLGEIIGLGTFSGNVARAVFKCANILFKLSGRKKFWEKFHPESRTSYLLFSQPKIGFKEINALAKALHVTKSEKTNPSN